MVDFSMMGQPAAIVNLVSIILNLIIIILAADFLVRGITGYSEKLGISDYITGMIIVALTASVPELVSSITGAAKGEAGVVFGTILGSNIAGIALALGIFALVGRKIKLKSKVLEKTEMTIFIFSIIPFLLVADGLLSRIDGAVLVLLYLAFIGILFKKEGEAGKLKKDVKLERIYKDALLFLLALTAIFISSMFLVFSSIETSKIIGISPYYVALVVIGIGATVPDITVGIRAILQGHTDVGIGGALGSMLIKSLLFLGVLAIIKPLAIGFNVILIAVVFTIVIRGIAFYFTEQGFMTWRHGLVLILMYIAFIVIESLKGAA